MTDGKNAVGLKGFPTPNTAAGIAGYLLFLFEDKEWAQWILGALEPLAYAYNFYESGDLSPDDAAEAFRLIVQQAPYNLKTCANPAGGKILRVAPNGRVQQLSDANTWETPDGDYTIPPVPEREGGTPPDQICLAAKNAAHVLELLYENVTDSFNNDLDETEAATALALGVVSLIGAEFAPITFALVTFFGIVFSVLYGLLEFVGADLWDETFTDTITCILQGCATNDGGVVTFDYTCFNEQLAAQTNVFDLTFEQLRLFGQIQYLLLVIGGADALDQAGATTAITDDDCSFCPADWCYHFDDDHQLGDWIAEAWAGSPDTLPSYSSGVWQSGYFANGGHNGNYVHIRWVFTDTLHLTDAAAFSADVPDNRNIWMNGDGSLFSGTRIWNNGTWEGGSGVDADSVDVIFWRNIDQGVNPFTLEWVQLAGSGDNPFGDDNC